MSEPFSAVNRENIRDLLQSWLVWISAISYSGQGVQVEVALQRDRRNRGLTGSFPVIKLRIMCAKILLCRPLTFGGLATEPTLLVLDEVPRRVKGNGRAMKSITASAG
jgi:hypothetical protein